MIQITAFRWIRSPPATDKVNLRLKDWDLKLWTSLKHQEVVIWHKFVQEAVIWFWGGGDLRRTLWLLGLLSEPKTWIPKKGQKVCQLQLVFLSWLCQFKSNSHIQGQFCKLENKSFNLAPRLMGFYALLMEILAPKVLTEVICSPLYIQGLQEVLLQNNC